MNDPSRQTRKPYAAPRIVEQGKVSTVTKQITPTPTTTPLPSGMADTFLDEF